MAAKQKPAWGHHSQVSGFGFAVPGHPKPRGTLFRPLNEPETPMPTIAQAVLLPQFHLTLGLADMLSRDIKDADFARAVEGCDAMHPAFAYGHLAIYPNRVLEAINADTRGEADDDFDGLFTPQQRSLDDADGSIYPPKQRILELFRQRHQTLAQALESVDDAVLLREHPDPDRRERFPTIGAMATFMVGGHAMLHLGQVSTWRRVKGYGPAMPHVS